MIASRQQQQKIKKFFFRCLRGIISRLIFWYNKIIPKLIISLAKMRGGVGQSIQPFEDDDSRYFRSNNVIINT